MKPCRHIQALLELMDATPVDIDLDEWGDPAYIVCHECKQKLIVQIPGPDASMPSLIYADYELVGARDICLL